MEAYKCDGCGKYSPDEQGLYIANKWTEVRLRFRLDKPNDYQFFTFCEDCIGVDERVYDHDGVKILRAIRNTLSRLFPKRFKATPPEGER